MKLRRDIALLILRSRLLYRFFGIKARIWVFETAKIDDGFLTVLGFELSRYRDVRYSRLILKIISALPDEVLEKNALLNTLFKSKRLHANTVKEGVRTCLSALIVSVRMR